MVFHEASANQCYIRDVTPGERGVPSDDVPVHGDRLGRVGFHKGGGLGDFVSKEVGLLRGDNFVRERGPASPTSEWEKSTPMHRRPSGNGKRTCQASYG